MATPFMIDIDLTQMERMAFSLLVTLTTSKIRRHHDIEAGSFVWGKESGESTVKGTSDL